MTTGPVQYHRHEGIVTLTLNRPESLNAMNEAMMGEIERILIELEADTAVRVVILTGAGRAFSSGGDQKRDGSEVPPSFFDGDPGGALIERLNRCVLRMQRLHKPIIGRINRVVPAEQLEQETLKLAERLAQGPTVAYGLAKTGLYQGLGMSLEDVLNMEARNQAIAARTPDRAEGVAAFREKRPPRFTGRRGSSPAR